MNRKFNLAIIELDIKEEEISYSEALQIIHDILEEYQLTPESLIEYS